MSNSMINQYCFIILRGNVMSNSMINQYCFIILRGNVMSNSMINQYQSQNAKRASSQKRHMVISIFLQCNSLILMSIGAGSIRAIKGGLDKVFKIRDRLHRIGRQILR